MTRYVPYHVQRARRRAMRRKWALRLEAAAYVLCTVVAALVIGTTITLTVAWCTLVQ